MTPIAAFPASASLVAQLLNPAARSLALACAAGLGLVAFRVRSTTARLFTWTVVLYAALAMPLLQQVVPPLPLAMPAFLRYTSSWYAAAEPARNRVARSIASVPAIAGEISTKRSEPTQGASYAAIANPDSSASMAPRKLQPHREMSSITVPDTASSMARPSAWSSIRWSAVAAAVYLVVAFVFLLRFIVGLALARRLTKASRLIDEPRMTMRLALRAADSRLSFVPRAAESGLISVPVTTGALRATILLPTGWREWSDAKLDAVIAHELSHVVRRDALTQRLSLLHRAIFWFSPLAWWLDRHLADLAEQASDEAALACGADCKDYARTLLAFFEALQAAPGRVWWQGVSMAKAGQAEQRLERILSWKGAVAMSLKRSIAVALVALAIPAVYLAASARPANYDAEPQHLHFAQEQTPPPPSAPTPGAETHGTPAPEATPPSEPAEATPQAEPAPAPAAITGTVSGAISGVPPSAIAPVALVSPISPPTEGVTVYPPSAALAPLAPLPRGAWRGQSSSSGSSNGHGFSYHYGYDDNLRFVIVSGKTDSLTMSGSSIDAEHVEKLRKTIQGDFIWFQRDEKSYIIRDQAMIDRAKAFWSPQEELGRKQEELGKQQEALGKQQEEIGARMEQVRVNVPDMTADLEKLKAELKALNSGATMEEVGHIQSEIGDLQSKIGDLQSQAGDQQSKLGEQMGALGEKQGKLGEQQGELGRLQGELAKQANRQMKQLLDEAITKGTAQPEQN
jgi:bla regulator protein blaR1